MARGTLTVPNLGTFAPGEAWGQVPLAEIWALKTGLVPEITYQNKRNYLFMILNCLTKIVSDRFYSFHFIEFVT